MSDLKDGMLTVAEQTRTSKYAEVLNELCEMQASHVYAARKSTLVVAEATIADLERQLAEAQADIEAMRPVVEAVCALPKHCYLPDSVEKARDDYEARKPK